MNKKHIRKQIIENRAQLTPLERKEYSLKIYDALIQVEAFTKAQNVASFVDFRNEVEMNPINEYILKTGKNLYLPYILMKEKKMTFHNIARLDDLVKSDYGILEPNPDVHDEIDLTTIDFVITPGVAFDGKGYRLGYGGGFYDRFLSQIDPNVPRIGLAFSLQMIEQVPAESHDQQLDALITENGVLFFNRKTVK